MKYDFTSIIDRKGKDAIAVDVLPNLLGPKNPIQVRDGLDMIPMWIADMNFPALPTITEAIIERAKHPTYGYFKTRDEYFDSIIRWHETRNHVTGLEKEHIGYENGLRGRSVLAERKSISWRMVYPHEPRSAEFQSERSI